MQAITASTEIARTWGTARQYALSAISPSNAVYARSGVGWASIVAVYAVVFLLLVVASMVGG